MSKNNIKESLNEYELNINTGLSNELVKERIDKGYTNKPSKANEKTIGQIIFHNVFTFFNIILFIIAIVFLVFIIYLYSSGNEDIVNKHFGFSKFIFLIPALVNVIIGTIQEIHGKRILDHLKIVTEAKTRVIRDSKEISIPSSDIVLDDIVLLKAGEQATADFKVLEGYIQVDESNLTGEANYVKKNPGDIIYSGSSIIVGDAKVITVEVGDNTFASNISKKVKEMEQHKSELMTTIVKIMHILSIILCIITIVIISTMCYKIARYGNMTELWDGMEMSLNDPVTWARIMITVGSFAVGLIPTGLVLTTSVTLVVSVVQLSKKKTLIQKLYSLENLSRVDTICLDKTGTLTDGTMTVTEIKEYGEKEEITILMQNLIASAGSRNLTLEALYNYFGMNKDYEYSEIIPFSSENKYSGLVYKSGDKLLLGAPEYLLNLEGEKLEFVQKKASEGKRVLALKLNEELKALIVIEDTIRDTAKETLEFFKNNGVDVKVISGDNEYTVSKIAQICGIDNYDKKISLEGVALEDIPSLVEDYTIFARVSPEQKEAIVSALQNNNHKVAMTGDGVNDILALRKADSSITFAKATDAAKSVSDVVLLDNDFSHLKEVVGEGRRVISNIQRTSILFLMKSFAITLLTFALMLMKKGQMWYTVENAYMLEISVIAIGGFMLSLESTKKPFKGSFTKTIIAKSIAAGFLATISILLPIMLYTIPTSLGYIPIIEESAVKTMISILLTLAGITVGFVMCLPFNKYRLITLGVVLFSIFILFFSLPTSFIGGMPTSKAMFSFNPELGETFMDSQFMKEFFKPWNSPSIQSLFNNQNNFTLIWVYILVAIPLFFIIMEIINKLILKNNESLVDKFINDPKRLPLKKKLSAIKRKLKLNKK